MVTFRNDRLISVVLVFFFFFLKREITFELPTVERSLLSGFAYNLEILSALLSKLYSSSS